MFKIFIVGLFLIPLFSAFGASSIDALRLDISEKNKQIAELQEEINKFQKDLDKTEEEADTLGNQIKVFSATISKLSADIRVTQKRIEAAELTLDELGIEISKRNSEISGSKNALVEIIRNMNEVDSQSLVEIMLAQASISNFFSDIDYIESLGSEMKIKLGELKDAKLALEDEKAKQKNIKTSLEDLSSELDARKNIEEGAKKQKSDLLKVTKNKEAQYRDLLEDRLARKEALEAEIRSIEEELRVAIDPSSLPRPGSGVLNWPLDTVFITQYFGNTPFATQNPQIYGGKGHNGIDLRASMGTPVKSAATGVVINVG
ncbi:MAG: hypothetical protein HYW09_01110, partial [Candidatus Niyogibacteria bacterium]|nr:hypothetical protein [Candidatus Niyogibacteria bacterium]